MHNFNINEVLESEQVTLKDMLDAREKRVLRQLKILQKHRIALISFTLNIPGSHKLFSLAYKSFDEGKRLIKDHLKRHNLTIEYEEDNISKTGYEAFIAVDDNPQFIKELMVEIENSCPMGRIFDIDVLDADGKKISREDVGSESRKCLICLEPAHACSRCRKHPLEELIMKTIEIMSDYFNQECI